MKLFSMFALRLLSGALGLVFPLLYSREIGIEGKALVSGIFTISIFINQITIQPFLFHGRKQDSLENIQKTLPTIMFTTFCLATASLPLFLYVFKNVFVPGYPMSGGLLMSYLCFLFGHSLLLIGNELIISSDNPARLLVSEVLIGCAILVIYLILTSINVGLGLDTKVIFCVGVVYLFFGTIIVWDFLYGLQVAWKFQFLPLVLVYRANFALNLTRTVMMSADRVLISFLLPFETLGKYFVFAAILGPFRRALDLWSQLPQKLNDKIYTRILRNRFRVVSLKMLLVTISVFSLCLFLTTAVALGFVNMYLGPEWDLGFLSVALILLGELTRAILSRIQLKEMVFGYAGQRGSNVLYYALFVIAIYVAAETFGINGILTILISFHLLLFVKHSNFGREKN